MTTVIECYTSKNPLRSDGVWVNGQLQETRGDEPVVVLHDVLSGRPRVTLHGREIDDVSMYVDGRLVARIPPASRDLLATTP